jgi:hypothetical protein
MREGSVSFFYPYTTQIDLKKWRSWCFRYITYYLVWKEFTRENVIHNFEVRLFSSISQVYLSYKFCSNMWLFVKITKSLIEQKTQKWIHAAMPTWFLTKVPKTYDVEKDSLFYKCCWENWMPACRKLKLCPCHSPCASINSMCIKDLNIRSETLKLVQERVGNTVELIGIGNNFLNHTPMAQ